MPSSRISILHVCISHRVSHILGAVSAVQCQSPRRQSERTQRSWSYHVQSHVSTNVRVCWCVLNYVVSRNNTHRMCESVGGTRPSTQASTVLHDDRRFSALRALQPSMRLHSPRRLELCITDTVSDAFQHFAQSRCGILHVILLLQTMASDMRKQLMGS
jgi:hypothetical protein